MHRAVFIGCLGACFASEPSPPLDTHAPPVQQNLATSAAQQAFLGVNLDEVDDALAYHLKLNNDLGVLVSHVSPHSTAEQMGLTTYDVIVSCDAQPVYTPRALAQLIRTKKVGDTITVEVRRGADTVTMTGKLQARSVDLDDELGDEPRSGFTPPRFHFRDLPPTTKKDGKQERHGKIVQPDGTEMEWSIEESKTP